MGSRERGADVEMRNPASQTGRRSRNRGVQIIQNWTGTGGVPDSKS